MKRPIFILFAGLGFLVGIFAAQDAGAVLGGAIDCDRSDRRLLSDDGGPESGLGRYTVIETSQEGTTVREYVAPSGIVFAVAWNGYVHPDLTDLLGSYAGQYREALKRQPARQGRSTSQVKGKGVIVEKWGRMRNLQGRAYAPDLIPNGVTIDEIK
jgi:hypothetical protein